MNEIEKTRQTNSLEQKRIKLGPLLWLTSAALLAAACIALQILTATRSGRIFPVYITEVMAGNSSYPNTDGRCCDYIEIYNSADYPVDLTGFNLGNITGGTRYVFPDGAVIAPGDYYVVYCDTTVEDAGYAPFGISRSGGEAFYLIASNNAIVDKVTTVATDPDQAMVLLEDGRWGVSSVVTPGRSNDALPETQKDIYNAALSPVRISELSVADTGYTGEYGLRCDWIELHNTSASDVDLSGYRLSDNVGNDKYVFPEGTMISADGYLVIYCTDQAQEAGVAPFGLSKAGGETVVLKDAQGRIVELVGTTAMNSGSQMLTAEGVWRITSESTPGFANTAQGLEAYLTSIGAVPGVVWISEIMAADQTVLVDSYGECSDWIELYNAGDKPVDLTGWYLSDHENLPMKWEIPHLELQSGERKIIFCSGRGTDIDRELHADFSLSRGGETVLLSAPMGVCVDKVCFGASDTNCSFIRDEFSSEPVLVSDPTPGYPNDPEGYEAFCAASVPEGPLAIWEVMTSNDWYLPQALGKCYDWVELRNISAQAVLLSDYSLTDDSDTPRMYTLPEQTLEPGASVVIILSGDPALSTAAYAHANFSLNAMEDRLYLYGKAGLTDCVYLKQIPLGYSYGREAGTGGFFYMKPTPGQDNTQGLRSISAMPSSEFAPGVYTGDDGFDVSLEADGVIYYTTDGSEPDVNSLQYTQPVHIDRTCVLRAISLEEGKLSSKIYTATFVVGQPHSIPVVSLVTDPENLWGPNGIYKNGDMSIKEEKRPANVAYLGEDGSFSLDCELSLHGATTVTAFNKKSFTVRFHDNYDGPLHYDVFGDGEVTSFRSLILRTSHESTFSSQMRDAFLGYVASQNCDTMLSQKHRYVALYLNGEYWGLYAIREHHSAEHFAAYMNVPASTVSMVRFCVDEPNSLNELYKLCQRDSLQSEENYAYAKTVLDMSSVADWIIFESYVGNIDINGNMRYYHTTVDGLWRCGLVDVDLGMFSTMAFDQTATSFHHGVLVDDLLQNKEFQALIATRLAELLAGPMSDASMMQTIDEIAAVIRPEVPLEGERWGCPPDTWEKLVVEMKDYCDGRAKAMIDSLCTRVGFSAQEREAYFGDLL